MRASDLLGTVAYDTAGNRLGWITELICRIDPDGSPRVHEVQISPGHRHRLLGYERPGIQGPWLLERIADWLHRGTRTIPWNELERREES